MKEKSEREVVCLPMRFELEDEDAGRNAGFGFFMVLPSLSIHLFSPLAVGRPSLPPSLPPSLKWSFSASLVPPWCLFGAGELVR